MITTLFTEVCPPQKIATLIGKGLGDGDRFYSFRCDWNESLISQRFLTKINEKDERRQTTFNNIIFKARQNLESQT